MASVLTGVMTSVIGKLTALLGEEYTKLAGVQREVNFMKDELSSMNALLQRLAEVDSDLDLQTKEWQRQVQEMSYDIEDCIDEFMHRVGNNSTSDSGGLLHGVVQQLKVLWARYQIGSKIQDLKARVEDANRRRMRYKVDERAFQSSTNTVIDPRLPSLYTDPDGLVGIDRPRDDLIKMLMEGEGTPVQQLKVISIVGPGGLGKTTLANEVYHRLERQFQCRAFVSLSQQPDVKKILIRNILYQVSQQEYANMETWDEEKFINAIRDFLQRRRYFIVIDDIWSTQAWKTIKCALYVNNCASRIMTTTRIVSIAKSCFSPHHDHVYEIIPLSTDNAKCLFFKRIFGSGHICPPHLEEISSEILKKCSGSPLAIVTMASLLANKASMKQEWDRVYNSIGSALEKDPDVEEMRRILSLSFDDLPHHLKTCLLYLGIFPEDYEIERDQLVKRWIAEGFITMDSGQDLEEIGENYFNDLINRSMIQPMDIKCDGRVASCRVHDMILDLLVSKSVEENFATFISGKNQKLLLQGKVRRLSINYYSKEHAMIPSTAIISHCRSLSIFGYSEHMPYLSKFRVLRVLDIENGEDMEHKYFEYIRRHIQLKYLRLHVRSISLPEQLGELKHLTTLDLGGTKITEFPKSIVQLQNLTCLRASNMELPEKIGNLHALQELSEVKINENCSANSLLGLGSLTKLRVLRLRWCIANTHTDNRAFIDNLLSSLRKLGGLNLRSLCIQSYYGYSIDFLLDSWFPTPQLLWKFEMQMSYHFPRIPAWIASLDNLTYLDINVDPVAQEALSVLGNLPSLLALWVTSKAKDHKESLIISSSTFICLKEFHFTCWSNGVGLVFEMGAMPKLEKLRVSFDAGAGLYFGIQHLYSLRHLVAEIICDGVIIEEVDVLEEGIRSALDLLPNHPTLEVRRW